MPITTGQFKQDVLRLYNEINKKIFNSGVKQQKVEVIGNKLVIISMNPRLPVLKIMDEHDPLAVRNLDWVLRDRFKSEIKATFEAYFHIKVVAVLKDYDLVTENSGTIVILEHDLQRYLNDSLEL
jgi:hypothetical protein